MAQQIPPLQQVEFHGVHTAGNPAARPAGTAEKCENLRVMPGYWLRLRGGRRSRRNIAGSEIRQLHSIYNSGGLLAQIKFSASSVEWHYCNVVSYVMAPPEDTSVTRVETISLANDSNYARTNPVAVCPLKDRQLFYNGLGVRGSTASTPPFSIFKDGLGTRYFGLDALCVGGNPTVAFAAGAGNNAVLTSVEIWVGLYDSETEHYSNGVYAGTLTAESLTGTITVSDLGRLKYRTHGSSETAALKYCFYATIDGGKIPYLILNSALNGPHTVAVTDSSASLSISAGTVNGWVIDQTKEVPTANHPPRPMHSVAYVNGRIYGALMAGGSGNAVPQLKPGAEAATNDFTYIPGEREKAAVVWSAAPSEDVDFLGDPLQSWPLDNLEYTPTLDAPVVVCPSPDGTMPLVVTNGGTFLFEEAADGIHEWITVSLASGIKNRATMVWRTPHGAIWVDQHGQIVRMTKGSTDLDVLSRNYQSLMVGTPVCSTYIQDPRHEIDQYRVYFSDGKCVIHDFLIGEAYTSTGQNYTAALTVHDGANVAHHIVANSALYTQEAQPEDGLIPTFDDTWVDGEIVSTDVDNGEYVGNWTDFGAPNVRKVVSHVDVIGDGEPSDALGESPLTVGWHGDFEEASEEDLKILNTERAPQSTTDSTWRAKLAAGHCFWFRLTLRLRGHRADSSAFDTHSSPAAEGGLARNFYGAVVKLLLHLGIGGNQR